VFYFKALSYIPDLKIEFGILATPRRAEVGPLIMDVGVHYRGIVVVAPPSNIAISFIFGADVPGNGSATIGIVEAVVPRFNAGGQ
jgi:uncharacterized membrane protein